MNEFEEKLVAILEKHKITSEHIIFSSSCHTALEASIAVGTTLEKILKNVCLMIDQKMHVIVVTGDSRVDKNKLKNLLKCEKIKNATPDEVLNLTGFPAGGVASFGSNVVYVFDKKLEEMGEVYTGGGSSNSLIKIEVSELFKISKPIIGSVSE
jgi:prolyl-tRNA editing enzyme YbaK/EbsC (Cys-tRNA(Pro) deacylase)